MKNLIIVLISCMFFTPLYAQQNSTTSSSPEQDIVVTDYTDVTQIDTKQSPIHQETTPAPASEEEGNETLIVQLDDFQSRIDSIDYDNDDLIVQLDDFQSRINAIDNEHESFTADLNDFQNSVNAAVEVDENLIAELNDLESRICAIIDKKENIIAELDDFQSGTNSTTLAQTDAPQSDEADDQEEY